MAEPTPIAREEVEARLLRAGLKLSPAQIDELTRVSGYIVELGRRVSGDQLMSAEPALTFSRTPR